MFFIIIFFFFFFQAEDGIRDRTVTGVQTCALPISPAHRARVRSPRRRPLQPGSEGECDPERRVRRAVPRVGALAVVRRARHALPLRDRKSTRLNSSHRTISYAVFCLKKKKKKKKKQ